MDAYTVRKMVPRIVLGVIAINLSIYFCVAMADIIRIVGDGIGQLLISPFIKGGNFDFTVGDPDAINGALQVLGVGTLIAVGGGATLAATMRAVLGQGKQFESGEVILFIVFTIVIPIVLISLAVLATIVIRQALLVFLIVVSPIAFALYILPSTEKYFRQWWDLFIKTLMVYPIIVVMFALSKIMSSIIFNSNQTLVGVLVGTIVMFLPLFLIPFSFKLAGGVLGSVYGAASNASKRIGDSGFLKGRREHYQQAMSDSVMRAKAERYREARRTTDNQNVNEGTRRRAERRARRLAGYRRDLLDREAEMNARYAERQAKTTGSGDDELFRAYTANLDRSDADRAAGTGQGDTWRLDNGVLQVRTAGGAWVNRSSATQAQERFGRNNTAALQQAMAYEMGKATTQEDQDRIVESFGSLAESRGLSENETSGVWIGAAFQKQNENRQWKHARWQRDTATGRYTMSSGGLNLMREVDEKQGAYAGSMQNADTWTTMSQEVRRAHEVMTGQRQGNQAEAQEVITRAARIAGTLGAGATVQVPDPNNPGQFITQNTGGSGAAGRVAEEMRAFSEIATQVGQAHGFDRDEFGTPVRTPNPHQSNIDRDQGINPGAPGTGRDRNP